MSKIAKLRRELGDPVIADLNDAAGHTSLRDGSPIYGVSVKSGQFRLELVTPSRRGRCDVRALTEYTSMVDVHDAARRLTASLNGTE